MAHKIYNNKKVHDPALPPCFSCHRGRCPGQCRPYTGIKVFKHKRCQIANEPEGWVTQSVSYKAQKLMDSVYLFYTYQDHIHDPPQPFDDWIYSVDPHKLRTPLRREQISLACRAHKVVWVFGWCRIWYACFHTFFVSMILSNSGCSCACNQISSQNLDIE